MILVDDRILTPEQQEFAEQHHGLLLKFMGTYGLTEDDYGILAERYVKTVKKYLETESLHQYRFSTILWYRLRSDLHKQRRRAWKEESHSSLDDFLEVVGEPDDSGTSILWSDIEQQITEQQIELLRLRAMGFKPREIARMQQCSSNAIHCRFKRIKKKLKRAGLV